MNLPWKTIRDVIHSAINARFIELDPTSGEWPCDYPAASTIKIKMCTGGGRGFEPGGSGGIGSGAKCLKAHSEFESHEIVDLGDIIPQLLEIKTKNNVPLKFFVQIELGDGKTNPPEDVVRKVNQLLDDVKEGLKVE